MQSGDPPTAPPGWYGDPWGIAAHRWWDGTQWTGHVAPGTSMTVPPAAAGQPSIIPWAHARYGATRRMAVWAKVAFAGVALVVVVGQLFAWGEATWLHHFFHAYRVHTGTGPIDVPHLPLGDLIGADLLGPLDIGAYVLISLWQHRAASTAQALGIPSVRSPGWGVAGWFVPVIQWWFPYQSVRDCLPAGDRRRPAVLRMWLCFPVGTGAALATTVLAIVGTPAGWATGVLAAVAMAGFAVGAIRVVGLIDQAHSALLYPEEAVPAFPDPSMLA